MKRDNLPKNSDTWTVIVAFLVAFAFIGSESIKSFRSGAVQQAIGIGVAACVCLALALLLVRHIARSRA